MISQKEGQWYVVYKWIKFELLAELIPCLVIGYLVGKYKENFSKSILVSP